MRPRSLLQFATSTLLYAVEQEDPFLGPVITVVSEITTDCRISIERNLPSLPMELMTELPRRGYTIKVEIFYVNFQLPHPTTCVAFGERKIGRIWSGLAG